MPALKPSSSATKFRNENELFEWLRVCCGCGPPTVVAVAGSLLGPGIVCTVDEGMMELWLKMIACGLIKNVRRDIEEIYKRLSRGLENGYSTLGRWWNEP